MQFTSCAQIAKTYGNKGELLLRVESDRFSELLEVCENTEKEIEEPVFIYFDGLPVPFFITSAHHRSNNAWIVFFSTIRDTVHAEEVVGKELLLIASEQDRLENLDTLVGYSVVSEEDKRVGTISKVYEYPGNICLELKETGILIPFHEDLVRSFDQKNKTISMVIPTGLIK